MIIGRFKTQDETGIIYGTIITLQGRMEVDLHPLNAIKSKKQAEGEDNNCDYSVICPQFNLELGWAWNRVSAKGTPYISVKIDNPLLQEPVHCAMFSEPNDEGYRMVWNRKERKAD